EIPELEEDTVHEDYFEEEVPVMSLSLAPEYSDVYEQEDEPIDVSPPPKQRRRRGPRPEPRSKEAARPQKAEAGIGVVFRDKG
nr:hypothetical protein [Armatimonadota bacterium]